MIAVVSHWFTSYGYAEVHDDLLIGAYPLDEDDVATLAALSVERVLNLVEDSEYDPGRRAAVEIALRNWGIEEHRMRLTDFGRLPPEPLETAVQTVVSWLEDGVISYIHCRAGWQRSAAVAAGAIAVYDGTDIASALEYVQWRKPSADPLPHQRQDLYEWWADRRLPRRG